MMMKLNQLLYLTMVVTCMSRVMSSTTMNGPAIPTQRIQQQHCTTETIPYSTGFGMISTQQRRQCHYTTVVQGIPRGGGSSDDDPTATVPDTVLKPSSIADLDAIIIKAGSNQQLIVIDFTASWCGPCQTIAPMVRVCVCVFNPT